MKQLLLASSLLLTGTAMAAGPTGFYLGGDFGAISNQMKLEGMHTDTTPATYTTKAHAGGQSLTAAMFGGYRFDMEDFFIAVEADLRAMDTSAKLEKNYPTYNGKTDYKALYSIGLHVLAGLPIGMNTEVYGRLGAVDTKFEVKEEGELTPFNPAKNGTSVTSKKNQMGVVFGVGMQHHIDDQLTLRFEYRYTDYGNFEFDDKDDIELNKVKSATTQQFTAGIQYNF